MRRRLLAVAIAGCAVAAHAAVPQAERDALVALYQSAGGSGWTDHTNWLGAPGTECTWHGVQCDDSGANVINIDLSNNHLAGTIPPEIGNFTKVNELLLYENQLSGTIPPQLGALSAATFISLEDNQLSGGIPAAIGSASSLTTLFLGGNRLSGSIPPEIGNLAQLQELDLSENSLSGAIPDTIGQLANLTSLNTEGNQLSGTIPASIGRLQKLQLLDLAINQLSGSIPVELTTLPALTELSLHHNSLTGIVPPQIANLHALTEITLANNALTGPIPIEIGTMTSLQQLDLSANQLTGTIPPQLAGATSLVDLFLGENQLTGGLPRELGSLAHLENFQVNRNQLTGGIPAEYGQLTQLQAFYVNENQLGGPLPSFASLTNLEEIAIYDNGFTGALPDWLTSLTKLRVVIFANNQFSGTIPSTIGNLTALTYLDFSGNLLTGEIPASIGQLTKLQYLSLNDNQFTGAIPSGLSSLTNLINLRLGPNFLSGTVPPLGGLKGLTILLLGGNALEGPIPSDIAQLTSLQVLSLEANRFDGPIPPELGNLRALQTLKLGSNDLRGDVPSTFAQLTSLQAGELGLEWNALTTSDAALRAFLDSKQDGGDFEATQTVPPANVHVGTVTDRNAIVSWDAIRYTDDDGGYQVSAIAPDGSVAAITATPDKETTSALVRGLSASTTYSFVVKTITNPHGNQQNAIASDPAPAVSGSTTAAVTAPADVEVTAQPSGLVQIGGVPQNSDSFILTNFGDLPANLTLAPSEPFFTLAPSTFTLAGGASQSVTITSVPQPVGSYFGGVGVTVNGNSVDLSITVQLLSVSIPSGTVIAQPLATRVETSGDPNTDSVVAIGYRNVGTATLTGIVVADVPWITTPAALITIAPGDSGEIDCTVVRAKRPDPNAIGTLEASVRLIYLDGNAPIVPSLARLRPDDGPSTAVSVSTVTVVDTTKPPVSGNATIPEIVAPDFARFIAGAGKTDVSIANAFGTASIADLRMYFTPSGGSGSTTSVATFSAVSPSQSIVVANVAGVYGGTNGVLQIRSANISDLQMDAVDLSGGTPSAIPIFRSDRSAAPGDSLVLAGVMKGTSTSTTISVQEVTGAPATVRIVFLDATGAAVGTPRAPDSLGAFGLLQLPDVVPAGAVTAIVTSDSASAGRVVAWATAVDAAAGDRWPIVDWGSFFGFKTTEPVDIPYALGTSGGGRRRAVRSQSTTASIPPHTEVVLYNPGTTAASGILRFREANGVATETSVTIAPGGTTTVTGAARGTGTLSFEPRKGGAAMTARIVFGNGTTAAIPVVASSSGIRLGQAKTFAGLSDTSTASTSFGIVESGGGHVTVRATLTFIDGRSIVATKVSNDYTVGPYQSLVVGPLASALTGFSRDLHDVQLSLKVVDGDGAATVFCISGNIVRVE